MTRWTVLREPLTQFLLIGLALFVVYGFVSPGSAESSQIVITQNQVNDMVRQFQSKWRRDPTKAELEGLIETYVREEIIYREGLSMGLDSDDAVVKRRIRQKYELIAEENRRAVPTDADLAAYLKSHPAAFARPAIVSFEQIYFDPAIASPEDVAAAKSAIENGASPAQVGQASMLPRHVAKTSLDLLAQDFGRGFADQVATAPLGKWVGPVPSGLGVHLVRINARDEPQLPPLDQVRTAVAREWESDQRTRARDADYRKLRANYDVVIKGRLN